MPDVVKCQKRLLESEDSYGRPVATPEAVDLKIHLHSRGIRVPEHIESRIGGAGPSDGTTILLGDVVVSVPTKAPFVANSPFELRPGENGTYRIFMNSHSVFDNAVVLPKPRYYMRKNEGGVPLKKIAVRHGVDAVGSTIIQACAYGRWQCLFCAISKSAENGSTIHEKSPSDIAEVATHAEREGFSHFVLTCGATDPPEIGIRKMLECARAVKCASGMKVHIQFEPPDDLHVIDELKGFVDSVAVNIESFYPPTRWLATPGKSLRSLEEYIRTWKKCVDVLGPGQVTSFVILGLGESNMSVLEGTKILSLLGVYPFLLPLRPLLGTPLERCEPPPAWELEQIFLKASQIVEVSGLKAKEAKAGCVRCKACSAFPDFTG